MKRIVNEASDIEGGPMGEAADEISSPRSRFNKFLPQKMAAAFWRRVLGWLYSFSLVIFMILTFGFVLVTPVDVLIQTWGTSAVGVKLFIVLAANSFFILASIVYYFSRLIRSRVLINQIPAKSVYLPLEKNDLPKKTRVYITKNLCRCVGEISVRAGPLANENESFDYPGMTPPLYIQQRNVQLGFQHEISGLPENCVFDEVIDSIGLKIKADGLFAGNFTIPKHYTFREVILAIAEELDDEGVLDTDLAAIVRTLVSDYEKFKFGPDLIPRADLSRFLAQLEAIMTRYINSTTSPDFAAAIVATTDNNGVAPSTYTHTYSVGSRAETIYGDSETALHSVIDPQITPVPSRASFLDPFEYRDDSGSLRLRLRPGIGSISRSSSRSRSDYSRRNSQVKPGSDHTGRRNSSWSAIKSRFSGSRRSSMVNPFAGRRSTDE